MNGPLDIHPKTAAAGVSGTTGILVVWLLGLANVTVDPVVAGALVAALSAFGAWLAPLIQREVGGATTTTTTTVPPAA